jgi:Tfp pilus assembly protein PilO
MNFKKHLTISIGIFLGAAFILMISLFFLNFDIKNRANRIKTLRQELNTYLQSIANLASLRQDFSKAQSYFASLDMILPTRDRLVNFPKDINLIARQNKIDLSLNFGQETLKTANEPGKTGFTISAQGTLDNLLNFLKNLENSLYLTNLTMLDFTREGDKFKALITGQVFSF